MKKKILNRFIGALLLLIGIWFFLIKLGIFLSPSEFKAGESQAKSDEVVKNEGAETDRVPVTDQGVKKPDGLSAADWMRYLKFHAAAISENKKINFYAKCIDQFGKPVQGLKVRLTILGVEESLANVIAAGGMGTQQSKEEILITTGADGLIVIEGKRGSCVQFEMDYSEEFSKGKGHGPFNYGSLLASKNSKRFHKADKNNPVIYNIWRRGPKQAVYFWNEKGGRVSTKESDRYTTLVNMLETPLRSILPPPRETSVMLNWARLHDAAGKARRWSMTVDAGEGGLIHADLSEEYGCLAPEDGYSPVIKLDSDSYLNESDKGRHWFYRSADKKVHATFRLHVDPNANGEIPIIYLEEIKSNPTGSRNLEYFPDKTLNTY